MSNRKVINIRPQSKHHQWFSFLFGVFLLAVSLLMNLLFWQEYKFQLMLLMFACLILILIGYMKLSEPSISYQLSRNDVTHFHRYGNWKIMWQEVIRIGELNTMINGQYTQLPYLGIKLQSLESLADNISPRLANKLLHEQQELLILAVKNQGIYLGYGLINFEVFHLNNKIFKGPIAAWLHRTEQLSIIYGYHLFLPESSFDRELTPFLSLLKSCKNHAE